MLTGHSRGGGRCGIPSTVARPWWFRTVRSPQDRGHSNHQMSRRNASCALASIAACTPGLSSEVNGPAPDVVLFWQIADLPGVESADLRWELHFGNAPGYMRTVVVDDEADALCVLDQTLGVTAAALASGREDVTR